MKLDPKEVVEYIEASTNVIEAQKTQIEKLEKEASEKDEQIQSLESKSTEQEKVALPLPEVEQKVASSQWGSGEKTESIKSNLRESEKILYERFNIPIN